MKKNGGYEFLKNNSYNKKLNDIEVLSLYRTGRTDTEISKLLDVSNSTIFYWRKNRNLPTNTPEIIYGKLIKQYHKQHLTDDRIAEELTCLGYKISGKLVCSYRNRLGLKSNSNFKPPLNLSYEATQVLLGTSIADSHVFKYIKSGKGYLDFAHSLAQENYALWKGDILRKLDMNIVYKSNHDKRTGKIYQSVHLRSKGFLELGELHDGLYNCGIKDPKQIIIDQLDAIAWAVMFMDDGYIHKSGYMLSFNCFSRDTNFKFIKRLNMLGVKNVTLHSSGVIYINKSSREEFRNLVKPYMREDLMYKLHKRPH